MRITEIAERSVPISRYLDDSVPSAGLTTSIVAVATDIIRDGAPVVGYGFSSVGRYAQSGLIRERFAPRLLGALSKDLVNVDGTNLDPFAAWNVMMSGEKAGGHGERCVAVGTLDMAIWDAASKIAELPLWQFLSACLGTEVPSVHAINVYAGGGYPYPARDINRLTDEVRRTLDLGFAYFKMKVGALPLGQDLRRIEAVASLLGGDHLAVDAMNAYDRPSALQSAVAFEPFGLWWFEDVCDPLDFDTQKAVAQSYSRPIAAGEALFSWTEARMLANHGGLRKDKDILVFDPTHCYGVPGYLKIIETMEARGFPRKSFWPHGGHLFAHQLVKALGLGGAEVNPFAFPPFGGVADQCLITQGQAKVPDIPGIGFESRDRLAQLFLSLLR